MANQGVWRQFEVLDAVGSSIQDCQWAGVEGIADIQMEQTTVPMVKPLQPKL